jgi:flagellar assembly factor FliW
LLKSNPKQDKNKQNKQNQQILNGTSKYSEAHPISDQVSVPARKIYSTARLQAPCFVKKKKKKTLKLKP